jgi:hypothetical protein
MRYLGIRISNAVTHKSEKLQKEKLFLYQAKTGEPVWVPLPKVAIDALKV